MGGWSGLLPVTEVALAQDIAFLVRSGFCRDTLERAQPRDKVSRETGDRINCNGLATENEYFRQIARELDLEVTTSTSSRGQPFSTPLHCDDLQRMSRMIQVEENDSYQVVFQFGRKQLLPAPDCRQMDALKQWIFFNRKPRPRSNVATLSVNRSILEDRCSLDLSAQAVDGLRNRFPSPSARRMITTKQALVLFLFDQLLVAMALFSTPTVFLLLYLTATPFISAASRWGFWQPCHLMESRARRLWKVNSIEIVITLCPPIRFSCSCMASMVRSATLSQHSPNSTGRGNGWRLG
ncbi:MAG: hypothetical protein ACR2PF_14020 [Rhizobiaceae bacterium]